MVKAVARIVALMIVLFGSGRTVVKALEVKSAESWFSCCSAAGCRYVSVDRLCGSAYCVEDGWEDCCMDPWCNPWR